VKKANDARGLLALLLWLLLCWPVMLSAQPAPAAPAPGANCVVSAMNRNATMIGDYYLIPNVTQMRGRYRVRAACSDGTVGETTLVLPAEEMVAGPVRWGSVTPVPESLAIAAPVSIEWGQAVQLSVTAKGKDGATRDVSGAATGTNYTSSNPLLATVGPDGLLTVATPRHNEYPGNQVVITAINEGVSATRLINLGPRRPLAGRVTLEDGTTPAAGARVSIRLLEPSTEFPLQVAGSNGDFSLPAAPVGPYQVSAVAERGGPRTSITRTLAADGAPARFDLKLNGFGTARVRVELAGKPLVGGRVELLHGTGEVATGQTGADGVAQFREVIAGPFSAYVRDLATGELGSAVGEMHSGGVVELAVQLRAAGTIWGRVGREGAPRAGIQVRVLSAARGLVSQSLTKTDGMFRFDSLPPAEGPYTLQALANGQLLGSVGPLVLGSPGQELRADIEIGTFAGAGSVTGKVFDAAGQPLPGVDVTLVSAAFGLPFTSRTDAQGVYLVSGVPLGAFQLQAGAGASTATAHGELRTDGERLTIDLRMQGVPDPDSDPDPVGAVSGTVLLSNGQPATGADVELRHALAAPRRLAVDANGAFAFDAVPPGGYALDIRHGASGERQLVAGGKSGAQVEKHHQVALAGVSTLRVRVTAGGVPAAGARVALALQGMLAAGSEAVSDAAGIAEFIGVPRAPYGLTATRGNGGSREFGRVQGTLREPGEAVDLAIEPSGLARYTLGGRVLDALGRPVPGQWVRLSTRDRPFVRDVPLPDHPGWNEYLVRTDAGGRYQFMDVALDDAQCRCAKLDALVDGALRRRVILETPADGASVQQDLVLTDSATITGTVRSHKDEPLAQGSVTLGALDGEPLFDRNLYTAGDFTVRTDAAGQYALVAPLGSYRVGASTPFGSDRASRLVALASAGEAVDADFVLVADGAVYLRVHVDSTFARSSAMFVVDNRGYEDSVFGSGTFSDVPLDPGTHRVQVAIGDNVQSREVTVSAGDRNRLIEEWFAFNPTRVRIHVDNKLGDAFYVYLNGRLVAISNGQDVWETSFIDLRQGANEVRVDSAGGQTRKAVLQVDALNDGRVYDAAFTFSQFDVTGTVTVDGAAAPGVAVIVKEKDPAIFSTYRRTTTDAAGRYRFSGMRGGQFLVTARNSWDSASATGMPGGTPEVVLDLAIRSEPFNGSTSAVKGTVYQQGGFIVNDAWVTLTSEGSLQLTATDDLGQFQFDRVKAGPFTLTARSDVAGSVSAQGISGDQQIKTVDLTIGAGPPTLAVSGTVRYSDGTPVPRAFVVLYGDGYVTEFVTADDNGRYSFSMPPRPFELAANDVATSGLSVTASGVAGRENIALDLVLPPTASVTGTVYDASGAPLGSAAVLAHSSGGTDFVRYAQPDAQGRYRIDRLALGTVQVGMRQFPLEDVDPTKPVNMLAASGTAQLDQAGATKVLDLRPGPATESVGGRVLDTSSAPVPHAWVMLTTERVFGPAGLGSLRMVADAQGGFQLQAPPGRFRLWAFSDQEQVLGFADGLAGAAQELRLDVLPGRASTLPVSLPAGDGAYQVNCDGSALWLAANGAARGGILFLTVDDTPAPCVSAMATANDGRALTLGPVQFGTTRVTRKLFSQPGGAFLRVIETFTNEGTAATTVKVRLGGVFGTSRQTVEAGGAAYAVVDTPPGALVFGGEGAAPAPANSLVYEAPSWRNLNLGRLGYQRTLTIAPGATASLMHYMVPAGNAQAAAEAALLLATNRAPSMFDQIEQNDKQSIINFAVP
jgi:protocatechuate 3,4-dioxygenase beta subunit